MSFLLLVVVVVVVAWSYHVRAPFHSGGVVCSVGAASKVATCISGIPFGFRLKKRKKKKEERKLNIVV